MNGSSQKELFTNASDEKENGDDQITKLKNEHSEALKELEAKFND